MAASASALEQGLRYLREGSIAESVEFLLKAIVEDPSDVELYLYLGLAYAKQEELDKAIHILEQAVDVAPASAKAHYNLGVAYHRGSNLTQAKDEYLRALGLDPTYAAAKRALDSLASKQSEQPAAESGPPEA